jgi:hypothetical protein
MCHDVQIPHFEDGNPANQVSVTVPKLPEGKSDNGWQRQTPSRHRIPPVTTVCRRGNRSLLPERVLLRCGLLSFGIQMDPQSSPQQRRTQKQDAPEDSIDTKLVRRFGPFYTKRPIASLRTLA